MARTYNTDKWVAGKTKFRCPAKEEGGDEVVRVFIGQLPSTRSNKTVFKFQVWSEDKQRGVGRPLEVDEIPDGWKLTA